MRFIISVVTLFIIGSAYWQISRDPAERAAELMAKNAQKIDASDSSNVRKLNDICRSMITRISHRKTPLSDAMSTYAVSNCVCIAREALRDLNEREQKLVVKALPLKWKTQQFHLTEGKAYRDAMSNKTGAARRSAQRRYAKKQKAFKNAVAGEMSAKMGGLGYTLQSGSKLVDAAQNRARRSCSGGTPAALL